MLDTSMQVEDRTRVSPANNIPALQGNTLRAKIVNQVFRDISTKGIKRNLRQCRN
jgi:hypothetical protein